MSPEASSSFILSWGPKALQVLIIPVSLYYFNHWNDSLREHGESLARVETAVNDIKSSQTDLKQGQTDLTTYFDDRVNTVINDQADIKGRIAALERSPVMRPYVEEPRYFSPPVPSNPIAAFGNALSHLPMLQQRGKQHRSAR